MAGNGTRIIVAATVMLTVTAAVVADDPAPPIGNLLRAIETAKTLRAAGEAYATARAREADNPDVHRTFMTRSLTLGRPMMGYLAARQLVGLEPKDTTAWALIGYTEARRSQMDTALIATLKAAQYGTTNPSLMNNLGAMVRWYEDCDPKPVLPKALKDFMDQHASNWRTDTNFSNAYDACDGGYVQIHRQRAAQQHDLGRANKAVTELKARYSECDTQYRRNNREITRNQTVVRRANATLTKLNCPTGNCPQQQVSNRRAAYYAAQANKQKRDAETRIRSARSHNTELRKEARELKKLMASSERKLAGLKRLLAVSKRSIPPVKWMPPPIDGKVTMPVSQQPVTDDRSIANRPAPDRQIKMARMLLGNGRKAQALHILQAVIRQYPNTHHATVAQGIIDEHKLDYKPAR